jgi:hypothetical protein
MKARWNRLSPKQHGVLTVGGAVVLTAAVVLVVAMLAEPEQRGVYIATVIALGTLAVIAWQSWETRRAAQAAEQGSASTRDALAEAEKGRLDQQATATWVMIQREPWPPREPSLHGGFPNEFVDRPEFALPGAAGTLVLLQADGSIRNEGTRTVLATFSGSFRFRDPIVTRAVAAPELEWSALQSSGVTNRFPLAPGASVHFRIEDSLTVEQWAANGTAADLGEDGPNHIAAQIILDDGLDNGVSDIWTIELGGRPLQVVGGKTGVWTIAQVGMVPGQPIPTYGKVLPRHRRYWRSRTKKIEL